MRIKLSDPQMTDAEERAVVEVLRSGRLISGPRVRAFEEKIASLSDRRHAVAISSGTTALLAAMKALGVGPGSVVAVPALTFPAPAGAAAFLGAKVRVCDIDPLTFNISKATLMPHLKSDVSLVVAIDQFGAPAPISEIEEIAAPLGIPVLVDAACSLGSAIDGKPCGSMGKAAIFSFHPRKVVTTGEGGAVVTDDDALAAEIRRMLDHGRKDGVFESTGINLRLGEIAAAIGEEQIKRLDEIVAQRRALAARYEQRLGLKLQKPCDKASPNYQTLVALMPPGSTRSDRDDLVEHLRSKDIEAGLASYCLGAVPGIAAELGIDSTSTPAALQLHELGLALPLHPGMSFDDVDEVASVVQNWLKSRGAK